MDETLETKSDIFFEAGDHVALVHLSHDEFMEMMAGIPRAHFVTHH
jgi:Ala-tRNA(Pro) deacylase